MKYIISAVNNLSKYFHKLRRWITNSLSNQNNESVLRLRFLPAIKTILPSSKRNDQKLKKKTIF